MYAWRCSPWEQTADNEEEDADAVDNDKNISPNLDEQSSYPAPETMSHDVTVAPDNADALAMKPFCKPTASETSLVSPVVIFTRPYFVFCLKL